MSARVSELARLLRSGGQTDEQLAVVLHDAHECDIAAALELLDIRQRARLYRLLGVERLGDVFAYVSDAGKYLRELPQEQAADIVEAMDADDAVDALETVSPELRSALMEKLDPESQHDIRLICSYQPDEIGSAMSTNFVSINRHLSVKQAMRALIAQAEENDNISTLFVSDDDGSFYGAIALKDLIVARSSAAISRPFWRMSRSKRVWIACAATPKPPSRCWAKSAASSASSPRTTSSRPWTTRWATITPSWAA